MNATWWFFAYFWQVIAATIHGATGGAVSIF